MSDAPIPADVLEAARAVGLKRPLWYTGRRGGSPPVALGLDQIVITAGRDLGIHVEYREICLEVSSFSERTMES